MSGVVDSVAPLLLTRRPDTGASGVPRNTDLVLEFDSEMAAGTGGARGWGAAVSVAVTGSEVRVLGRYVVVDPVADLDAGVAGRVYTVTMAAGVLTDTATTPNAYGGLSGTQYTFTVANTAAPLLVYAGLSPANGATGVATTASVTLTFDEAVKAGSGFVVLTPALSGAPLEISIADGQVSVSGSSVVITPTGGLPSGQSGQAWRVEMAAGVVLDTADNAFLGLFSRMNEFTVADAADPALVARTPAAGAAEVPAATTVVLVFNEAMQRGTGDIVLTPAGGVLAATTVAATSSEVAFSGATVTITPAAPLAQGQEEVVYTAQVAAGALLDAAGRAWAGIQDASYQFTLADATAPALAATGGLSPASGATGVAASAAGLC